MTTKFIIGSGFDITRRFIAIQTVPNAARISDFDEALACIQDALDIDGSMAGEYFDKYNGECWGLMPSNDRRALLSGYVDFETYQEATQ